MCHLSNIKPPSHKYNINKKFEVQHFKPTICIISIYQLQWAHIFVNIQLISDANRHFESGYCAINNALLQCALCCIKSSHQNFIIYRI